MIVAFGCDHAGFTLRDQVLGAITSAGHGLLDCGATTLVPGDDYPDYTIAVARAVADARAQRGVVVCGSGVGASIAANKVLGIRAALCHDGFSAHQGVEDDSMNILCLGARVVGPSLAAELVQIFLRATFSGAERHQRRLQKVFRIEAENRAAGR